MHKQTADRLSRIKTIKSMAKGGYRAMQIAAKIGIGVEHIRLLARENDIDLPDAALGYSKRLDPNRIIEKTVIGAEGVTTCLDLVDGEMGKLERLKMPGWIFSLDRSIRALQGLTAKLRKELKNGN